MSFLSDLVYGIRRIFIGSTELPNRSAIEFVGATAADDAVNGRTVITITGAGAAPATRTISAGAGLVGGGDLSANRALAVKLRTDANPGLALYGTGLGVQTDFSVGTSTVAGLGTGVKVSTNGGLVIGQIGADNSTTDVGVGVKFTSTAGLSSDTNGLVVKVDGTRGQARDAGGLYTKIPASPVGIRFDGTGAVDVDATKVAVYVGGRVPAAARVGWIVATFDSVPVAASAAISSTQQLVTSLNITGVAVGDEIWIEGDCELDNSTATNFITCGIQLKNPSAVVVMQWLDTKTMGGGGRAGNPSKRKYVAVNAGTFVAEFRCSYLSGATTQTVRQAHLFATVMRPNP